MTKSTVDISVMNFSPNGSVNFRVVVKDCNDSAGRFEYEYEFTDISGNKFSKDRRQTWTRTHNRNSFTVSDQAPIAGGKLVSVRVLANTIEHDCFD